MKGKNVLKLNQQTMCEALQVWANKEFSASNVPTVTNVAHKGSSGTYGAGGDEFEVTVEMAEKAA